MTLHSQNGWPVRDSTDGLVRFAAGGREWWAANADVAVVFGELIRRYALEVEPIAVGKLDDWSWAKKRPVRGSTSVISNHSSATAVDLNALDHVRGVRGTFTGKQLAAGQAIRRDISDAAGLPVLAWGEQFTTTVDGMHWEIRNKVTAAQVKQAADKIRAARQAKGLNVTEKIKLTAHDALVWSKDEGTKYEANQEVSLLAMIRNPTAVRELRAVLDNVVRMITVPPKPAPPKPAPPVVPRG